VLFDLLQIIYKMYIFIQKPECYKVSSHEYFMRSVTELFHLTPHVYSLMLMVLIFKVTTPVFEYIKCEDRLVPCAVK